MKKTRARRRSRDGRPALPRRPAVEDTWPRPVSSPTAVAAEAMRTGILPRTSGREESIPHEGETIRVGDPDDLILANEYVGENTPGGTTPTPDQNGVDEIGRAYGLQEEDSGSLRTAAEILERRDRRRSELRAPTRRQP